MTPYSGYVGTPRERFAAKCSERDENGCVNWLGSINAHGYGTFGLDGRRVAPKTVGAHRFAYEQANGAVPEGLHLDHLCRNRACVNPEHLEPVTVRENILRGISPELTRQRHAAKTHCPNGHEYTPENVILRDDRRRPRQCKTCLQARWVRNGGRKQRAPW